MSKKEKKALGKGIRALLNNIDNVEEIKAAKKASIVNTLSNNVAMLALSTIEVNPFQPRTDFDEDALNELATSIKVHGLIQPLTVRRLDNKNFQLISGERRMRASKMAGLTEVPAYVRLANDQEMLEMALVENIQREDLNAIEVAITYQRLMDECSLTHEKLSARMGKKRSTITNYTRLLKLPPEVQLGIKSQAISMGHARALAGVDDIVLQLSIFKEIKEKGLSVRKTEDLIRAYQQPKEKKTVKPTAHSTEVQALQDSLCSKLGTKVAIKRNEAGKGSIVINFTNDDDFNRILELIED